MATSIMVISPSDTLRTSLEALITQGGYTITPGIRNIEDFRHALNASETPANVILFDYWLSQSVSLTFIRSLKRQGFVVILMGTPFLGRDVAETEQVSFLEKPFSLNELLKIVKTAQR